MAQVAANHLAGRRVEPPPSKSRAGAVGGTVRGGGGSSGGRRSSSGGGILRRLGRLVGRLRLQGGRVDAVGVEALVDGAGLLDKV